MAAIEQPIVEAAPVRRGWLRRNWKRLLGSMMLLIILAAVGGYFAKFGPVLFSQPYQTALHAVEQSPQVQAVLGKTISRSTVADWTPSGLSDDSGQMPEARLTFSVSGAKNPATGDRSSATVMALARQLNGQWGFAQFDVTLSDGTQLNLLDEINAGKPADVKPFDPTQPQPKATTTEEATPDQNIKIDDLEMPPGAK